MCRLFPTITFNYGSLQCGLVKGLAIRSLSLSLPLFHHLSLSPLAQFWSLARLHVKTTQIAPCSLYTPHSSLYVSQPRPEYLTDSLLIHIFHSLGSLFSFFPPPFFSILLPPSSTCPPTSNLPPLHSLPFSEFSPPPGPDPVCGSWRVQGQQGQRTQ